MLFVILSPVGPYYPNGFKPVSLYGTTEYICAAPGGAFIASHLLQYLTLTHSFIWSRHRRLQVGCQLHARILPQKKAALQGYEQNLWLHGPEHYLTEVGTMNLFVVLRKDNGGQFSTIHAGTCAHSSSLTQGFELITPPLDGMILPGVTRDSVLTLAREHSSNSNRLSGLPDDLTVSERPVTMLEVKEASESGKLVELFGAGMSSLYLLTFFFN